MTSTARVIQPGGADWGAFGTRPFAFEHTLAGHELLTLPRLHKLAASLVKRSGWSRVACLVGDRGPSAHWSDWGDSARELDYCFEHLPEPGRSYVVIKNVEQEPEYAFFLATVLAELKELLLPQCAEQIT